jgi:hypothetical protein
LSDQLRSVVGRPQRNAVRLDASGGVRPRIRRSR